MEHSSYDIARLASLIIEFYEKISSWEHATVKGSGLTPAQMHAIEIIGQEKSLRMKELAQKMGVTTGTLTVMVDKLEGLGHLERKPHEKDRRSFKVRLTSKGRRQFNKHRQFHLNLAQDIVADFSSADLKIFLAGLEKINSQF